MFRVIVVEDEVLVRKGLVLTTNWTSMDCEIIGEAGNGQEGYELICKLRPDIVITDIKMPLMDGLELIEQTLELYQPVFIILSAYRDFEYAKKAISLDVLEYLLKPFKDEELKEALNQAKKRVVTQKKLNDLSDQNAGGSRYLSVSTNSKHENILKAIELINQNFSKDISIGWVADQLSVSESYLSHLFKMETDYTFHELLTRTRMNEAAQLLKDSNIKIYEVTNACGYKDQRYFSIIFKRYFGISPLQYKERIQHEY